MRYETACALYSIQGVVTLTDKVYLAYSLGRTRILDGLEMTRVARGIDAAQMTREPSLFSTVNTSSPLRLDGPMIEGIIEMSRRNQVITLTPFTLSGAVSPVTLAGALAQQNAEALAGIAFIQMVNPGAPAVYGGFTSNVDMKSGAPAFGTPEYTKAALAGGSWRGATSCPTARPTPKTPTRSKLRPPTNRKCSSGAR